MLLSPARLKELRPSDTVMAATVAVLLSATAGTNDAASRHAVGSRNATFCAPLRTCGGWVGGGKGPAGAQGGLS